MGAALSWFAVQTADLKLADGCDLTAGLQERVDVASILQAADGGLSQVGSSKIVGGLVKTGRLQGAGSDDPWAFLQVSDGTCFEALQVIVSESVAASIGGCKKLTPTGTSVLILGELAAAPEGVKQKVELRAKCIIYSGACDAAKYPLAKKQQSFEFLREKAHLRPRTSTLGAVSRIRNALATATHRFFQESGFLYVHTPIITTSDCEGAGEMFQVTTLLSGVDKNETLPSLSAEEFSELQAAVAQQGETTKAAKAAAKADKNKKSEADAAVAELLRLKTCLEQATQSRKMKGGLLRKEDGTIDYGQDFFASPAFLTVSGQLNAEFYATALSKVYTFGPTFRAENSHTARHLAEFWMIEPEMAWCDLNMDMKLAEAYVQACCKHVLQHCRPDLEFFRDRVDKACIERLEAVASTPFKRLSYTEGVQILEQAVKDKKTKFENKVAWGVDLASEHERYLTEEVFKQPVIVYDYPKDIKAFYMRLNDDGKTVAAMDVLVPKVGELIGGSQREERLAVLEQRMQEGDMPVEPYIHYLDTRRFGAIPHAGFGLGFERLVLFATGLDNIREVIPFPRWPGHAEF